ncbi:unnamed protein product [Malus baccata var. baccata]
MAAIFATEIKLHDTGSAVKTSRYVTAGAAWLNGVFGKGAKAGQVAVIADVLPISNWVSPVEIEGE